jgi:hypothetical protein
MQPEKSLTLQILLTFAVAATPKINHTAMARTEPLAGKNNNKFKTLTGLKKTTIL